MEPVRVKVYGLFSITKQKYIAQLFLTFMIAATILVAHSQVYSLFAAMVRGPRLSPKDVPNSADQLLWWLDRIPYLVMVILVLVCVEAFLVFRAFARKEAEQAALEKEKEKQAVEASQTAEAAAPAAPEKETGPPASASEPEQAAITESKSETS